jgi:nucleoside-diphosphate-sugar epimerase
LLVLHFFNENFLHRLKSFFYYLQDWYDLSKTLAEREAFAYAEKTGLDVVTICPSLVLGPLIQSTVNASSKVLLNYLKGGIIMSY